MEKEKPLNKMFVVIGAVAVLAAAALAHWHFEE